MEGLIASDKNALSAFGSVLEGYDCPAILLSADYTVVAMNTLYQQQFGEVDLAEPPKCYEVSHGYDKPCDQAGEDCPLISAQKSGHKERVLHVHQTPRGKELVDVELVPLLDEQGGIQGFIELMRCVQSAESENASKMIGKSKAFLAMVANITRVSQSDASILLLGESGAGKELAARAIHCGSERRDKSMVTLECAGLQDSLFESELFGHVKGAFTGAHSTRAGLVELANGGTLFLDEIGDVPLSMQVKLLRLLESGTYRPVGSAQVKSSNFRLICATHKNIEKMVDEGRFRLDLYYRINVFPIRVPSLKERIEDLPLLVEILLKRIESAKSYHFTESAMRLLKNHSFRGNIRELRNILTRAILLSDTNLIEEEVLRESLQNHTSGSVNKVEWVDLKTAERRYLEKLMAAHDNDKTIVADIAGLSLRSLYRKLEALPE